MHAFQHRPIRSPVEPVLSQEWAHGFCYLARQNRLWFGHDRHEPVEWRPVVSLERDDNELYILPGTRRLNPDFFHLTPQDGLYKQARADERDTYLCPRYEVLDRAALHEIGVLHHPVRIRLLQWLRS